MTRAGYENCFVSISIQTSLLSDLDDFKPLVLI